MTTQDIQNNFDLVNQINILSSVEEYNFSATLKFLQLDEYVVHRIELLNNSYDSSVLNTSIDLGGVIIGDLFYLKNQEFETSAMSLLQFYVYLSECEVTDLQLPNFAFKYNYILIHKDYIDEFHLKFSSTSAVWGGFKISENIDLISYYKKQVLTIEIPDELKELDLYAQDSILRALDQKHSFERYLKLYHLLELEFDYSLIKKIQSLNITTDSNSIGSLLNEYSRNENERLFDLISGSCFDVNKLASKLNNIKSYQTLGEEIFIKFGKGNKGNLYLSDLTKYNDLLADSNSFLDINSVQTFASVKNSDYNKFIHTVTAYWIYRVRCSIAHYKLENLF
jgi:hypothetical protein